MKDVTLEEEILAILTAEPTSKGDSGADPAALQKLADSGDAEAQYALGELLVHGDVGDREDGLSYLKSSAEKGNLNAADLLGKIYFSDAYGLEDDFESFKYAIMAAEKGYAHSQCRVAYLSALGRGTAKDPVSARKWIEKAAMANFDCQFALAVLADVRAGVPIEDSVESRIDLLLRVIAVMTPSEFDREFASCGLTLDEVLDWRPGTDASRPLNEEEKKQGVDDVCVVAGFKGDSSGRTTVCVKTVHRIRSDVQTKRGAKGSKRDDFRLPRRRDEICLSSFELPELAPPVAKLIKDYIRDRACGKDKYIYESAGIPKTSFNDYKNGYKTPSRDVLIRIGFVLNLNLDEEERLLAAAGHAFNMSDKRELVCRQCFKDGICHLLQVNEILYEKGCELLEVGDLERLI